MKYPVLVLLGLLLVGCSQELSYSISDAESVGFEKDSQKLYQMVGAGVCQASCPISYAANTTFLSNSLLSFDGFSQTSLTGFQLRTERFFQRSGLASLAVS